MVHAPSTARGRLLVGVLIPSVSGPYEPWWLATVDAARAGGLDLVAFVGRELDDPREFRFRANPVYDLATGTRPDGLVVFDGLLRGFAGTERVPAFLRSFEVPLVTVGGVRPGRPGVRYDRRHGMRATVEHLITEHGSRRIAYLGGPVADPDHDALYRGYRDALAAHGIPFDSGLTAPPPDRPDPHHPAAAVTAMVDAGAGMDALVAASAVIAGAAITALTDRGLRVPDDVAVVGFDPA